MSLSFFTRAAFYACSLFIICSSCESKKSRDNVSNNGMYDFDHPKVLQLDPAMDEISGLAYYAKDTSVFAIIDEDGLLFKIPLKNPKDFKQWKFDKRKDFEDVVMLDTTLYVLVSNGDIERLTWTGKEFRATTADFGKGSKKKNEFEIVYQNPDSTGLTMICKDCEDDDKTTLSTYEFDPSTATYTNGPRLDMIPFAEKIGVKKHLKPSAAAINPVTGDLYLISSIQGVLLVLDKANKIKEMFKLTPKYYKQPEGIAFTPDGNLIISNEFADDGFATLLLIKNQKLPK